MSFLNPLMLWGALGAAIPVIIHLWGRRPRRVQFPSIRLIQAGQQRQRSFARVRELLVMLLRMLLIFLVSCALAGPVAESRVLARLSPSDQHAVIIVDTSASMGYRQGAETSLARAKRAARTILQQLPAGFTPSFHAVDGALRDGQDIRWIEALQAGFERGRILDALNAGTAADLLDPRSRVFLVTDLQESNLRGELIEALPQPPVIVDVGATSPANHAITEMTTQTACPLQGPLELGATVSVKGANAAGELNVIASAEGASVPGHSVPGTPGEHRTRLRFEPDKAGDLEVSASLPPDALPCDDTYYHIVRVRERLRVTVIAGRSDPRPISLALNPGEPIDTRIAVTPLHWDSAPVSPPDADVLILTDTPPGAPLVKSLPEFVKRGGGLILFTGPDTQADRETLSALLGAPVTLGATVAAPRDQPFTLSELNTLRPPLEPFANPQSGNLLEFRFTQRRALEGAESARVLARFSDGSPAILGTLDPDRHFVLVNTSLDGRWTNASFLPGFVPLAHRLCYDVAGPAPRTWLDGRVGQPLWADAPPHATGPAEITGPDGRRTRAETRGRQWLFTPRLPGVHEARWREGSREVTARFAANISPAESDLTRIAPAELKRRLKARDAVILKEQDLPGYLKRTGLVRANLTRPLLLLALLVLAAESFLTLPRRRTPESEEPGL